MDLRVQKGMQIILLQNLTICKISVMYLCYKSMVNELLSYLCYEMIPLHHFSI